MTARQEVHDRAARTRSPACADRRPRRARGLAVLALVAAALAGTGCDPYWDDDDGETPPADDGGGAPPADGDGEDPPGDDGGDEGPPGDDDDDAPPDDDGGGSPGDGGDEAPPDDGDDEDPPGDGDDGTPPGDDDGDAPPDDGDDGSPPEDGAGDIDLTVTNGIAVDQAPDEDTGHDAWRILRIPGEATVVRGTYDAAVGAIELTAQAGGVEHAGEGRDGAFELRLPDRAVDRWRLTARAGRARATVDLHPVVDRTAPVPMLEGPAERTVHDRMLRLVGTVRERWPGVAVHVASDRFPDNPFGVTLDGAGHFDAEVPLKAGDNDLRVVAVDRSGNTGEARVAATDLGPVRPEVTLTAPRDGAHVFSERIQVTGEIYSGYPIDQLAVTSAGREAEVTGEPGAYRFSLPPQPASVGTNSVLVRAAVPSGVGEARTTFRRVDDQAGDIPPPRITVNSPLPGERVSGDTVTIRGRATGGVGIESVAVNGDAARLERPGEDDTAFRSSLTAGSDDGERTVRIVATDALGSTGTVSYTIRQDDTPPGLSVAGDLEAAPATNSVVDQPYRLEGTVTDSDPGGVSVGGETVTLQPADGTDRYRFAARIGWPVGETRTVAVAAWDIAGNRVERRYRFERNGAAALEVVSPRPGSRITNTDDPAAIDVTVRGEGLGAGHTLHARIDDQDPVVLQRTGDTGNATLTIAPEPGPHRLTAEVRDAAGDVVGRTRSTFTLFDPAAVELELVRSEPANGADGVEPDEPLSLYFSRPIDPDRLEVELRETVHGRTYARGDGNATGISGAGDAAMKAVHRDRAPVPINRAMFPGESTATFYGRRAFAYGARVFAHVRYDGEPLARLRYDVRPTPTLLQGTVATQFGTAAEGVPVELADTGRRTVTDADGAWGFGFGVPAGDEPAGGRRRVVANPGRAVARLGTVERWVTVNEARLNSARPLRLPALNTGTPRRPLAGGDADVRLAGGNLRLDLTGVRTDYPDGSTGGSVHVQFMESADVPYRMPRGPAPSWLYALHPSGIEVTGQPEIRIRMPALNGSRKYIPDDGYRVALIGLDDDALALTIVGAGHIDDGVVVSDGELHLERLDYIGYALVPFEQQQPLQQYARGERSLAALRAALR